MKNLNNLQGSGLILLKFGSKVYFEVLYLNSSENFVYDVNLTSK